MMHELQVDPKPFERIKIGAKTFLIEDSEHGFQPGDTVQLIEFDRTPVNPTAINPKGKTGRELKFEVGFVEILDRGHVVFSLLPMKKVKSRSR